MPDTAIDDPVIEGPAGSSTRERNLKVVLEIAPKGSCFMEHIDGQISDVEMHFPEGNCHCDVTVCRDEGERRCVDIVHHSGPVCRNCPGTVFGEYDLVPQFLERLGDRFIIRTYLPANHRLADLVEDLREVSHSVRVLRILDFREDDVVAQTADVDLSRLTEKQRATLETAVERGYFESPPEVSLAELSDEFDVSESALSQRLARAERTVLGQLFSP